MHPARLDDLIQRYIDRRLTTAERAELERELLASVEARRVFWRHLQFEGMIQETVEAQQVRHWMTEGERAALAAVESPATTGRKPRTPRMWWYVPAGMAAALAFVFLFLRGLRPPAEPEPTSNGVAVLTGSVDVRWDPDQAPLEPGSILPPGRLRMASGLVGIEFYGGARVTVQGPADIDVAGVDRIVCRRGRLRIQVSERARGFRLSSPQVDLVDLGTEFGVDIAAEARTELHVFNGRVELSRMHGAGAGSLSRELVTGQGLRFDDSGVSRIPAQPGRFAGQQELDARLLEQSRTRLAAWQEAAALLRADPRLVLHYDFQPRQATDRLLPNRSPAHGDALDGTVVGARWAEGRWEGKAALEFREPSDRVRIFVPGEFDALTLVAWVRVDSFDTQYSGILLTDGFVKGAVHWQFCNGRMRLGIAGDRRPDGRIGVEYDVDAVEPAALLGRWRQVAVVVDTLQRAVVHYLDGRPVKRSPILKAHRLSFGKAELGNWGLPDNSGSQPIRNFNGRMDEFLLFKQALTDAEIAALFEQGRPWPSSVAAASR